MRLFCYNRPQREWPSEIPNAPDGLSDVIGDAMVDFGPDGHRDGEDVIAAIVWAWLKTNGHVNDS
jgi:hypothetical protein